MKDFIYFEDEKKELDKLRLKASSLTLKFAYLHKSFAKRINFMISKLDEEKGKLFLEIKESGLYENFDDRINSVISRLDYIKETLNGFAKHEFEKDILKEIEDPHFAYKITKLLRRIDDDEIIE